MGMRECSHCGVVDVTLFACSRCKQTHYWTKSCQAIDWKNHHKTSCKKINQLNASQTAVKLEKKKKLQIIDKNECANCSAQGSCLLACSRCKLTSYCSKACQFQHWSAIGGHKRFCVAKDQRFPEKPDHAGLQNETKCVICQESLLKLSQLSLPCSHVFHSNCVTKLCEFSAIQVCPICRTSIPKDLDSDGIFEDAFDKYMDLMDEVDQGESTWESLLSDQKMKEILKLLVSVTNKGNSDACVLIGNIYHSSKAMVQERSPSG